MKDVGEIIRRAAGVDVTVLICGETGTGKDLVARTVHHLSSRQGKPFVKVNCAAMPRDLLESELFGHERGAVTGAHRQKIGKFEAADGGTIFLTRSAICGPRGAPARCRTASFRAWKSTLRWTCGSRCGQTDGPGVAAGRFRGVISLPGQCHPDHRPAACERREESRSDHVLHRAALAPVRPRASGFLAMEALVKHSYPGTGGRESRQAQSRSAIPARDGGAQHAQGRRLHDGAAARRSRCRRRDVARQGRAKCRARSDRRAP